MRNTLIALCATAIAAPLAFTAAPAVAQDASITIQYGDRYDRRDRRDFRDRREARRYYNGHRGYRERRAGYRYHDGWWFPPAAFALGAIVGGAIANDAPRVRPGRMSPSHVEWCYDRWRSYRAYDNSYQPNNGPRRQCVSPYG